MDIIDWKIAFNAYIFNSFILWLLERKRIRLWLRKGYGYGGLISHAFANFALMISFLRQK